MNQPVITFDQIQPYIDQTSIVDLTPDLSFDLLAATNNHNVLSVKKLNPSITELESELMTLTANLNNSYRVLDASFLDIMEIQSQLKNRFRTFINPQDSTVLILNPENYFPMSNCDSVYKLSETLVSLYNIIPNQMLVTHQMIAPMFCNMYTEFGIQGQKISLPNSQVLLKSI